MKTKALNFANKFKYELGIFVLLCLQALLNFNDLKGISDMFLSHYLVDFSMGKTSRLFVGSIVNILTDNPTEEWLNWFARIVLLLTLILTAAVLGRVVRKTKDEMKLPVYAFLLFFATGSFTMHGFSCFFGMLDVHMFIFAVIAVVFAQNRYLRWLVPVLCVVGVLVNYVFTISYFPIVILVILYLADRHEKKAADIFIFCITVIITLVLTFFFAFEGKNTMTVTFDEMWSIMEQKLGAELSFEQVEYFNLYLFGDDTASSIVGDISQFTPIEFVTTLVKYLYGYEINLSGVLTIALIAVPIMAVFCLIWIMCIRREKKKSRRFVYACFMLSMLFIPVCCLLSTDLIRWISAGVLTQFGLCFYMFYAHDEAFEKTVEKFKKFFTENKIAFIALFVAYAFTRQLYLGT